MPLLIAFILVPLIEIALFIQVGVWMTLWPTLGIVVLTSIIGAHLVRKQGAAKLQDIRRSLHELEDPTEPLAHGIMILFSGALLLTPGFFTDAVGFALLVPQVRSLVMKWGARWIQVRTVGHPPQRPDIIDGTFEDLDRPKPGESRAPSGWTQH